MRLLSSCCVLLANVALPAHAETEQIQRGPVMNWVVPSDPMPVPPDASGAAFIRYQDTTIHLDDKGQLIYNAYRVKILHSSALSFGNLTIGWNPEAGAPTAHVIKIYRDRDVIDVLQKASFEILRREDELEAAKLDGRLTAVLRIPDLRVGDELEFGVTTRVSDPTLGRHDAGLMMLGPEPAPGRYRLRLSWEEGSKPIIQMSPTMQSAVEKSSRSVDFRFDHPTTLTFPKDAPLRYAWQRTVEFSRFADWASLSRRFAPLYGAASRIEAKSPIRQEIARIAGAHAKPFERMQAALKLVQQDVRYIYVGLNGGNLTPASAAETWQRRYGDCKGKTVLLLAMLRELGIEAQPVLVNNSGTDDGFGERLPSPRLFDHVLVRAKVDGKTYWLDGTLPPVASPSLEPVLPYQWVLPLSDEGSPLERRPWKPAGRPDEITLHDIDARSGFDQPALITRTTITRGIEGLQQEVQLSALSPAQLLSTFRQHALGDTWQSIESVVLRYDQKAEASVLTIRGKGKVEWEDDDYGEKSLALPGGGFFPPDKRVRFGNDEQAVPFYTKPAYVCDVATVRLPATTRRGQWSHAKDVSTQMFGKTYYRAFELRAGSVRMVRASRIEQTEIDVAVAQRDNGRIASFDNSKAYIYFDPKGRAGGNQSSKPVPATDEVDWTADTVPCLPTQALAPTGNGSKN